ncbi:MAG: endonuclease MutS2 [Clostridia bacterium]|nr:endonuclease MutS2 [Clostridia bacterium]
MYEFDRCNRVLELDKVLSMLASETGLSDAARMAEELTPTYDRNRVDALLRETADAHSLMARFGAPSFGGAPNVNSQLMRAKAGGILSPRELLEVGETLRIIRTVRDWRLSADVSNETAIDCYFDSLVPNKFFEDKIFLCIKNDEELSDNASTELFDIRRKISSSVSNIRSRLDKLVKNQNAKFLQENIVTQRDGRYVVPVKAEHRSEVAGLVHDTSASGATLFIEPMAVVEINNEIKVLKAKEKAEIERILSELSSLAADFADCTVRSYDSLTMLNLIFAKAKLGYRMKATIPDLSDDRTLYLKNARHPLIKPTDVVPVTVGLGRDYDTLIITGPNTGGKTVTLKTIGLLTLMTMCGLMIPVSDGSSIYVFDKVLVDIGDEQSIEQSLSTFSSHMANIVNILSVVDCESLVLIDELGSGTDPIEGAALANAILIRLRELGARIAATTHYAELKSYALDTDGVENACCEFDVETLRPTYRLLIGVPGRSNAFAISSRLGLSLEIVENARGLIDKDDLRLENIIGSLEQARLEAEKEREMANKLRSELVAAKNSVKDKLDELERERIKQAENAKSEAMRIVDNARAQTNKLLDELEEIKKSFNASNSAEMLARARRQVKGGLNRMQDEADPIISRDSDNYVLPRPLTAGDNVIIYDINKQATVLTVDEAAGTAVVQAGIIKTKVDISNLRLSEKKTEPIKRERKVKGVPSRVERTASAEVDLRGMASDEAIMELDKYIDNAVMCGIPGITIIHGKGTGVLRKSVQQHLRNHKNIRSFRLGVFGEGEDGVTIAEIKS